MSTSDKRESDDRDNVTFFRAGKRFFRVGDEWFYTTREGNEGPFPNEEVAARHLEGFLALHRMRSDNQEKEANRKRQRSNADPTVWDKQIELL